MVVELVQFVVLLTISFVYSTRTDYLCDPNDKCGCSMKPVSFARIVNGENAVENSWGWIVSLSFNEDIQICGGTILSSSWILTTAHCVYNLSQTIVRVHAGSNQLWRGSQHRSVARIILHPNFDYLTGTDDIALLQLTNPLDMNDSALSPICMPSFDMNMVNQSAWPAASTPVTIIGWGISGEEGQPFINLQQVTLEVVDSDSSKCSFLTQDKYIQLCAAAPNDDKDACAGDSGGPLMMFTPEKQWVLVGLTSFGEGCARKGHAGVYTRITAYEDWIRQHTNGSYSKSKTISYRSSSNGRTWCSINHYLLIFVLTFLCFFI